jgi:hypothetical protein
MLFITQADGTVIKTFPSAVYQGSNDASDIIVLAPFAQGTEASCGFALPNGVWTDPYRMTSQDPIVELGGVAYNAWRISLPYAITEYSGAVTAQFSFYTGTQVVTTANTTFTVQAGAQVDLPNEPDPDVYKKILSNFTIIDQQIDNLDLKNNQQSNELTTAQNEIDALQSDKLDKVTNITERAQVYVKYPNGRQGMQDMSLLEGVPLNLENGEGANSIVQANAENDALGDYAVALGYGCVAGTKAFRILSATQGIGNAEGVYKLDSVEGIAAGMVCSIKGYESAKQEKNWDAACTVMSVDAAQSTITLSPYIALYTQDGKENLLFVLTHPYIGTTRNGRYAHTNGARCQALAEGANAQGVECIAQGAWSTAKGKRTKANYCASAEGYNTYAETQYAHAEGESTKATGQSSHVEGCSSVAKGNFSHAEGHITEAIGGSAHAEGGYTKATGGYSHAEGGGTKAHGYCAHAEGRDSVAGDPDVEIESAHAEGYKTRASGYYSHSEGTGTTASDSAAHAEGARTTASGVASHAEGSCTTASGKRSHSGGYNATASGENSFAHGYFVTAKRNNSAVFGAFNDPERGAIFSVGNGDNSSALKNAFDVFYDGHAEVQTEGTTDNSVVRRIDLNNMWVTVVYCPPTPADAPFPVGKGMRIACRSGELTGSIHECVDVDESSGKVTWTKVREFDLRANILLWVEKVVIDGVTQVFTKGVYTMDGTVGAMVNGAYNYELKLIHSFY